MDTGTGNGQQDLSGECGRTHSSARNVLACPRRGIRDQRSPDKFVLTYFEANESLDSLFEYVSMFM